MALTLNEIKRRAMDFAREHADDIDEKSQAQEFWRDFFAIWGISARKVGVFEERARTLKGTTGFMDFYWPGTLLVEHKSAGKDLNAALRQALDYCISSDFPESSLPRYVMVCDFKVFRLVELGSGKHHEFKLAELHENLHLFNFILGYEHRTYKDEDPVNVKAAEIMGSLYDGLKQAGYEGHPLQLLLVRLMFCFFSDDTGIFTKDHLSMFLETKTDPDGVNLGSRLAEVFQILNTPVDKRQTNLDEDLALFPYVNGKLFEEALPIPAFDKRLREKLLVCSHFNWGAVSPAIFGSLFQSVMNPVERRNLGAHYTSEKNILKTIHGLFLDELRDDFRKAKNTGKRQPLEKMLDKIRDTRLLDPACGCGNFLILAYRELRLLEIDIYKAIQAIDHRKYFNLDFYRGIDVDNMYGIEIEEFPAQIARTALWIMDHIMNVRMSEEFGEYIIRLPLTSTPHIVQANALRLDWRELIKPESLSYILGNPPFVGKKARNESQMQDMDIACKGMDNYGNLDYVCCWYVKAAEYTFGTNIQTAFVSTNSIVQGEQVSILWSNLLDKKVEINFAHRTFRWTNEAKGKAAVYCVIIGFSYMGKERRRIFDYAKPDAEPVGITARKINPYLIDAENILISSRNTPLCDVPEINFGSMPNDDGNLLFTKQERNEFLCKEPKAKKLIRPFLSAQEFLHAEERYCLWLKDADPTEIRSLLEVKKRVEAVRNYRLKSNREATRQLAAYPMLFGEIRQPDTSYILIPRHSSEHRRYIPFAFFNKNYIAGDSCLVVPRASLYHFGILSSASHMAWVHHTCGRLESRFRYSNNLVYNNFPWPESLTIAQKQAVEKAAQSVLDAREEYPDSSLADLYDPNTMAKVLTDAHRKLDHAVDKCYRSKPFGSELERIEYLFELYEKYTAGFLVEEKKTGKRKNRSEAQGAETESAG